jgi:hypothetical protein
MTEQIVPDDKNWTWVLEKRCGDCGFDSSSFDYLTSGVTLRALGALWSGILAREDVLQRPRPDMWSPLEYGCHVRDVFRKFDERVHLMLENDGSQFENWDQDKTAIDDNYGAQSPATVSMELHDAALKLADLFDSVEGEQWQRRGLRSDGSAFTVATLAQYLMHDPVHHVWDVETTAPVTSPAAHRKMAIDANNGTWEFLGVDINEMSQADIDEMTRRANAAAYHWAKADGTGPANAARADWLLSRVWAVRGNGTFALHHANRCMETCTTHKLVDFDLAYAHECTARAYACLSNSDEALKHLALARGVEIKDPEDKAIVDSDIASEPWFGLAK